MGDTPSFSLNPRGGGVQGWAAVGPQCGTSANGETFLICVASQGSAPELDLPRVKAMLQHLPEGQRRPRPASPTHPMCCSLPAQRVPPESSRRLNLGCCSRHRAKLITTPPTSSHQIPDRISIYFSLCARARASLTRHGTRDRLSGRPSTHDCLSPAARRAGSPTRAHTVIQLETALWQALAPPCLRISVRTEFGRAEKTARRPTAARGAQYGALRHGPSAVTYSVSQTCRRASQCRLRGPFAPCRG